MAINDLVGKLSQNGSIEVCYLVEESARITNNTFKVWVPSVMGSIDNSKPQVNSSIDTKQNLNEGSVKPPQLQEKGYIVALNETPYAYRLDGYIPHHKTVKIHVQKGEWTSGNTDLSGPTTAAGCGPHTHETTGTHQANNTEFTDMTLEGIDYWNTSEIDYQNLHNKIIKKGHRMYGCFVNGGEPGEFVVFAISNVIPRLDSTAETENADRPDTSLDGKKNPQNEQMP
jgi:hypothetical protein|nr:MAG TPA: hypothetical protein [Bacteriophage sp.]